MRLYDLSIKRPVFITMIFLCLMVLGLVGFMRLGVDLFPEISFPFIAVVTNYTGAGPEEMESLISKPVENACSTISGLDTIRSVSSEGRSLVFMEFRFEMDIRYAEEKVREKVSQIRRYLPEEAEEPIVVQFDPDATPIIYIGVSAKRPLSQIRRIVEDEVQPGIEQVDGVAQVQVSGGLEREIQVLINRKAIEARGLSVHQVVGALKAENIDLPAGNLKETRQELTVRTIGKFRKVREIENVLVGVVQGVPVYVRDVATVVDGFKDQRAITSLNGVPAVFFSIQKQSGQNSVQVADRVYAKLKEIKKKLPPDFELKTLMDTTDFIRMAVADVQETIVIGAILAVVIVFLFLGHLRSTIITAVALPNSLIGTFFLMYLMNYTENMMTLMALSLAVGLLIDDAIVVRENIFRHVEEGMDPKEAASFGTKEVGLGVVAMTLSIVAVFLPIGFMTGITGQFFKQFGFTLVFAVMVSLYDAFTMAPMLSAYFIPKGGVAAEKHNRFLSAAHNGWNKVYNEISTMYKDVLVWALDHRKWVVFGAVGLLAASCVASRGVGSSFMGQADQREFSVSIEATSGAALGEMVAYGKQLEEILGKKKFIDNYFVIVGSTSGGSVNNVQAFVRLKPQGKERKDNSIKIRDEIRRELRVFSGVRTRVQEPQMGGMGGLGGGGGGMNAPIFIRVSGDDLPTLEKIALDLYGIVAVAPGIADPNTSVRTGKPELQFIVDRSKTSLLNISTYSIANTLAVLVDGVAAARFREGDKDFDIRVKLAEREKTSVADLRNVGMLDNRGNVVPLSSLAKVQLDTGPRSIMREAKRRYVGVSANLAPGASLGDTMTILEQKLKDYPFPRGYDYQFVGQAKMFKEMGENFGLAFLLAIVFIYMVLASLFESFLHPFIIMLSLPLSVIGAILALVITNHELEIMSIIGMLLLMGLVTKNAILLIDFTNQMRAKGMGKVEALLHAGPIRLRPILMTSFAMIFGMLPLAMGWGEGGDQRAGMAIVVIGGMITSTFLTLIVIPVIYLMFDNLRDRMAGREVGVGHGMAAAQHEINEAALAGKHAAAARAQALPPEPPANWTAPSPARATRTPRAPAAGTRAASAKDKGKKKPPAKGKKPPW